MNGLLEHLRTLATSGTRVAGLWTTPTQLVCGKQIMAQTLDVGTSSQTGVFAIELNNLLLCVEGRPAMGLVAAGLRAL
jgi:hypothetical protein